ncbi:MAG TPA: DUF433 domain-containing protein [Thermomicrobiales bacterium]|nr:DUF433 domain-containing protein [Thermomicrobiales bacterium]
MLVTTAPRSIMRAGRAIAEGTVPAKLTQRGLVSRDPDVHGDDAVFAGTRVPVESLVDWLAGGYDLDEYLENFPSVKREQALGALELLREALLAE